MDVAVNATATKKSKSTSIVNLTFELDGWVFICMSMLSNDAINNNNNSITCKLYFLIKLKSAFNSKLILFTLLTAYFFFCLHCFCTQSSMSFEYYISHTICPMVPCESNIDLETVVFTFFRPRSINYSEIVGQKTTLIFFHESEDRLFTKYSYKSYKHKSGKVKFYRQFDILEKENSSEL